MAEVLRTEVDSDYRYRLTRTDRGVLLSCVMRSQLGLRLGLWSPGRINVVASNKPRTRQKQRKTDNCDRDVPPRAWHWPIPLPLHSALGTNSSGRAGDAHQNRALGAVWLRKHALPRNHLKERITRSWSASQRTAAERYSVREPFAGALQSRGVLFPKRSPLAIHSHPRPRTGTSDTYANAAEAKAPKNTDCNALSAGNGDPLDFVISKNLHRRHLDKAELTVIAAKIADMKQARALTMRTRAQGGDV